MSNKRAKALMILGTASHVGKSVTVAALCRILRQDGLKVAPFKAQNMALNSFATREGREIGRAQAMQAEAAGIEPQVDMNPILLKPTSEIGAQVVLNGRVLGNFTAAEYQRLKPQLVQEVSAAYERLAAKYDILILEGAGSPVEMNLKDGDIVNLRMAELADATCILVADIDRGGVFASLIGTYELLTDHERGRFGGFVINKFRGDIRLLAPGIDFLEARLAQPCLGVVPHIADLALDEEDGTALDDERNRRPVDQSAAGKLHVCVVRLPYISNFTDIQALERYQDVSVYYGRRPGELQEADIVVLPGSKNTIQDLSWLHETGWVRAVRDHARAGRGVVGICGGFQMLGAEVLDPFHVEGSIQRLEGIGLLDAVTTIGREKTTRQAKARLASPDIIAPNVDVEFEGYEIHMGDTTLGAGCVPFLSITRLGDDFSAPDGAVSPTGNIVGSYLHGLFDAPEAAIVLLAHFRRIVGREASLAESNPSENRNGRYDHLALHFRQHLKLSAIYRMLGVDR